MAVGERFLDPDTQAAIAAQSGQAAEPAEKPVEEAVNLEPNNEPDQETPGDETVGQPASEQDVNKQGDDLDMTKVKQPTQEEVDAALTKAGFTNEALGKELAENEGRLTDATVTALKEHFGEQAVDNAVADMEKQFKEAVAAKQAEAANQADTTPAPVQEMNNFIYGTLAGGDIEAGKEKVKELSAWCKDNVDKERLAAINSKLASGNKIVVKEGLTEAVTLWRKGQERPMMTGDSEAINKGETKETFQPLSKDQFIQIMNTKKYKEDPAYAKSIDDRRRQTINMGGFTTPEYNAKYRPAIR